MPYQNQANAIVSCAGPCKRTPESRPQRWESGPHTSQKPLETMAEGKSVRGPCGCPGEATASICNDNCHNKAVSDARSSQVQFCLAQFLGDTGSAFLLRWTVSDANRCASASGTQCFTTSMSTTRRSAHFLPEHLLSAARNANLLNSGGLVFAQA